MNSVHGLESRELLYLSMKLELNSWNCMYMYDCGLKKGGVEFTEC